ncbi:L,D-transpeptidase family protein [Butyrivibrio sp. MC2013]|uniref:L,D-transpeptidase family protein n=1 Tax=Butyrivibrio sp. MC2013 TaxID=1280686 RepID=UPI00047C3122|nr:L,D-transpeptidase/peptidoglycan binding protein [Butyrivibrio sp. MC2013]
MTSMTKKILLSLTGAVLLIYLGVAAFFSNRFLPGSMMNGQDVSCMTVDEVRKRFADEASGYKLTIRGREDMTDSISARDIGFVPDFDGIRDDLVSFSEGLKWPSSFFFAHEYETGAVADYDDELLSAEFDGLVFNLSANIRKPVNAELVFDDEAAQYAIRPEDNGTEPDISKEKETIAEAIKCMTPDIDLDANDCYHNASIDSDDKELNTLVTNLNKYASARLSYSFGDNEVVVDGSMIKDWLTVDGTSVTFEEEKVSDFINQLARTYDSFGKDRQFVNHDGKEITIRGGDYGWWMDRKSTAAELVEAIKECRVCDMTPVYYATASAYGDNDWGDSYVEVDLDEQHVYIYENGELIIDCDCVSGKPTADRITPTGTYGITYKERDATLRGSNYSSDVKYWMPFNRNVGLHDASWRSEFGGDLYVTGGSHGCINLPPDIAEQIFEHVFPREAVLVYGGMSVDQAKAYVRRKKENEAQLNAPAPSENIPITDAQQTSPADNNPDANIEQTAPAEPSVSP